MIEQQKCTGIVIVGGGSAGWLLACRLASALDTQKSEYTVTLIESPDIKTVGVGEGTWPTMRRTLQSIGLSETEFMRRANVSLKQGTRFNGWRHGGDHDFYYHPFEPPIGAASYNVGEVWRSRPTDARDSFSVSVTPQETACLMALAPKSMKTPEYKAVLNYGYHLDAGAFGEMLSGHGRNKLGIQHVLADVVDIEQDEQGWIKALSLNNGDSVYGDLFFDCTGFRSLLLHQKLGVPFEDLTKFLFVNAAVVSQQPYGEGRDEIQSATHSTAHEAGWIWDIGLSTRRGVGLVFSTDYLETDRAGDLLTEYLGGGDTVDYRSIRFQARRLEKMWCKNAVAVGLSAGFVEPLEASALMLIESVADWFCHRMPSTRDAMNSQATRFNMAFHGYWDRIIDFLKFHYVLSERTDPFWVDNRHSDSIPDTLKENMEIWNDAVPYSHDFRSDSKIFSWESYQYVYLGMRPEIAAGPLNRSDQMAEEFELNKRICDKVAATLPTNCELIDRVATSAFPVK